ncbi:MAG: hypothetical protein EOP11_01570 [Proteobacteria bacterium]|nr:MAG: hypothetical protein EOP11_01570 [Pseudomonadota bacterium]
MRAQNFRLSQARGPNDWLLPFAAQDRGPLQVGVFLARQSEVGALYADLKSKDSARIQDSLQRSYGKVYDAAAKIGAEFNAGNFRQNFSLNAAASLRVNDPVFPELSGVLFNDYALSTSYGFRWEGWSVRPKLTYGLRRVLARSFTVGQLLDGKPNAKLKSVPYRLFAEFGAEIMKSFGWGDLYFNAASLPLRQTEFSYYQLDLAYRTPNLLGRLAAKSLPSLSVWVSTSPVYGGDFEFVRTIRAGISANWLRYFQADIFTADKLLPGAIVRLGPPRVNLQLYTFARAEDDQHVFIARQYGLAVQGSF